jgi:uncharacterized protein (DUF433 family)
MTGKEELATIGDVLRSKGYGIKYDPQEILKEYEDLTGRQAYKAYAAWKMLAKKYRKVSIETIKKILQKARKKNLG